MYKESEKDNMEEKSKNVEPEKNKDILKDAIKRYVFKDKTKTFTLKVINLITQTKIVDKFIDFLIELRKNGKISFKEYDNYEYKETSPVVRMHNILKNIEKDVCCKEDLKELISEFLLNKYSMLNEKYRKSIDKEYDNLLKEKEEILQFRIRDWDS